jgi:hypothetical protein
MDMERSKHQFEISYIDTFAAYIASQKSLEQLQSKIDSTNGDDESGQQQLLSYSNEKDQLLLLLDNIYKKLSHIRSLLSKMTSNESVFQNRMEEIDMYVVNAFGSVYSESHSDINVNTGPITELDPTSSYLPNMPSSNTASAHLISSNNKSAKAVMSSSEEVSSTKHSPTPEYTSQFSTMKEYKLLNYLSRISNTNIQQLIHELMMNSSYQLSSPKDIDHTLSLDYLVLNVNSFPRIHNNYDNNQSNTIANVDVSDVAIHSSSASNKTLSHDEVLRKHFVKIINDQLISDLFQSRLHNFEQVDDLISLFFKIVCNFSIMDMHVDCCGTILRCSICTCA